MGKEGDSGAGGDGQRGRGRRSRRKGRGSGRSNAPSSGTATKKTATPPASPARRGSSTEGSESPTRPEVVAAASLVKLAAAASAADTSSGSVTSSPASQNQTQPQPTGEGQSPEKTAEDCLSDAPQEKVKGQTKPAAESASTEPPAAETSDLAPESTETSSVPEPKAAESAAQPSEADPPAVAPKFASRREEMRHKQQQQQQEESAAQPAAAENQVAPAASSGGWGWGWVNKMADKAALIGSNLADQVIAVADALDDGEEAPESPTSPKRAPAGPSLSDALREARDAPPADKQPKQPHNTQPANESQAGSSLLKTLPSFSLTSFLADSHLEAKKKPSLAEALRDAREGKAAESSGERLIKQVGKAVGTAFDTVEHTVESTVLAAGELVSAEVAKLEHVGKGALGLEEEDDGTRPPEDLEQEAQDATVSFQVALEENNGQAYLEALELLSNTHVAQLRTKMLHLSQTDYEDHQKDFSAVEGLLTVDEEGDDDDEEEADLTDEQRDAAFEKLCTIGTITDRGEVDTAKLSAARAKALEWLQQRGVNDEGANAFQTLHDQGLRSLAMLVSGFLEVVQKTAELMCLAHLEPPSRATIVSQAEQLKKATTALETEIQALVTSFVTVIQEEDAVHDQPGATSESAQGDEQAEDPVDSSELCTNLFLESSASITMLGEALQLLIPLLQVQLLRAA
eukprot:m.256490 g.256490  ORF g.256490 m.256490 type:complete len:688 (+) comp19172_c2_seq3:157-2220(+)